MDDALNFAPSRVRSGGVVMVITLLAIILIASLLFYVFNVGTSVQSRVVTQHAADSAAIGGASQVARSMNTVAMNNVETARLIAAVSYLDGVPLAVDLSITDATESELGDVDALAQAVSGQLRAGVTDVWFARKLREMIDQSNPDSVIAEQQYMRELDELFRNQPNLIPEMTHYQAPSGNMGKMHQAMRSMDAHSQAVMATLAESAQTAAIQSVQANLGQEGDATAGLLLPATPYIPWQRGKFADYERPMKYGLLPGSDRRLDFDGTGIGFGQIDNEEINRGPWDALFGWRTTDRINDDPGSIPSTSRLPPQMGRARSGREPEEYRVFGPQHVMLWRTVPGREFSWLRDHLGDIYSCKSSYLWSDAVSRTVTDSKWEIDIDYDDERSSDRNSEYARKYDSTEISAVMYVIVEIKSRIKDDPGLPQRQGITWDYVDIPQRRSPRVDYRGGSTIPNTSSHPPYSVDPRSIVSGPTWKKIDDHIWRMSAVYETDPYGPDRGGDPSIGLAPKLSTDDAGNQVYVAQKVYWQVGYMLVGVNVGEQIEVTNPWEGFNKKADDAPAPIDIDHGMLPANNYNARFEYLTFLGVARQSNSPKFWPSRFQGDKPYPYNTAIAQAYVFNNHSWDLWTQAWQANLEPVDVDHFDDWVQKAEDAVNNRPNVSGLESQVIDEMAENLRILEPLAPVMLNH